MLYGTIADVATQPGQADDGVAGGPRRFDSTPLVDDEIIGSFIDREFLTPRRSAGSWTSCCSPSRSRAG